MARTITWDELRDLAGFEAEKGCAISLYLDLDPHLTPTPADASTRLHSLLDEAAKALKLQTQSAPVIARDPSGVLHTIVLGAGAKDGVLLDDVVISDRGVVGRVSEVGNNYSKVLLVTDSGSAVSALVQGSRAAGIVRGQYGDTLVMDWILQTEDVKVGDVVITAGLAIGNDLKSLYPKGLILGKVVEVTKGENGTFQRAILVPAVDLRHLENVLVVNTSP